VFPDQNLFCCAQSTFRQIDQVKMVEKEESHFDLKSDLATKAIT